MNKNDKIFIAGNEGMVGSAIHRFLLKEGFCNFVFTPHREFDLTNQYIVANFFEKEKPKYVFLAAGKVGGIAANMAYKAQFIYENLMIQSNIIHQSYIHKVSKLLFFASSSIYPKYAPQPIKEEYLLSGYLEPTNESYSIAKIAGIKLCTSYRDQYGCDFISVIPTNLYGINDHYHPENSHVLPSLIRRIHEAKINKDSEVIIWGSGAPRREFLYVDDLAEASVLLMKSNFKNNIYNVGFGSDISIAELAELIKKEIGYTGKLIFDSSKPDGMFRKLIDSTIIRSLGFSPKTTIEHGIHLTYKDYFNNPK